MKGKLAYAFVFFVAYGVITSTFSFITRGPQAAKDSFVSTLVALGAL
jgi:phosphate transport system permease protein